MKYLSRRTLLKQAGFALVALCAACRPTKQATSLPATSQPQPTPTPTAQPAIKTQPIVTNTPTLLPPAPPQITVEALDSCFSRYAQEAAADFAEATQISAVFHLASSWDEYLRTIAEKAAGNILDIIEVPTGLMTRGWARFGYICPMNPYLVPLSKAIEDIFPGIIDACTISGSLYALPYVASIGESLILFNRGLFDATGSAYPQNSWTMEYLAEAAEGLNIVNNSGHLVLYGYVPQYSLPGKLAVLRSFKSELFSPAQNRAAQPADLLPFLKWYYTQLYERRRFPNPYELTAGPLDLFIQGKAAMIRSSFGTYVQLAGEKEWLGAALLPSVERGGIHGSYLQGLAFALAKSCPRPEASIEWCQYISSETAGVQMMQHGCSIPGCHSTAWRHPSVVNRYPISLYSASLAKSALPEPVPTNLRQQQLYQTWQVVTEPFWKNRINAEECAEVLSAAIQQVLDEPSLTSEDFSGR